MVGSPSSQTFSGLSSLPPPILRLRFIPQVNERLLTQLPEDDSDKHGRVPSILEEDSHVPVSSNLNRPPHRLALFAKSLKEIEALRIEHTQQVSERQTR